VQDAVDAVADAHVELGRLDVDVGRAVLHALADDEVRQLDDRRVLGDLAHVGELFVVVGIDDGERCDVARLGVETVDAVDRGLDRLARRDDESHIGADHRADVVDGEDVGGISDGHHQRGAVPADRQRLVAARQGVRDHRRRRRVDGLLGKVDVLEPGLRGEGLDQVDVGDDPARDEHATEDLAGARLLSDGGLEVGLGDQASLEQDRTQGDPRRHQHLYRSESTETLRAPGLVPVG
jgi:hypothetical protein